MTSNSRQKQTKDLFNLIITQLHASVPIFINHINRIFSFGSNKKMIWINTISNIAFMKDQKIFWNYTYVKFIANTMGKFKSISDFNSAISAFNSTCGPVPARFGFDNVFHKSSFKVHKFGFTTIRYVDQEF